MLRKVVSVGLWFLAAVSLMGCPGCDSMGLATGIRMSWASADGGMSLTASWSDPDVKGGTFTTDGELGGFISSGPGSHTFAEPFRHVKWDGTNNDGRKYLSDSASFEPILTDSVTLYPISDSLNPAHACHALAFTTNGYCHASAYNDEYHGFTWFVLVDSGDSLFLLAADKYRLPNGEMYHWSGTGKVCVVSGGFSSLQTCPDSTAGWDTREQLEVGGGWVYALGIYPRFAKLEVTAIQGKAVTLRTAVQWCSGLRWVKTD